MVILKAENAFGLIPALFAGLLDRDGDFPDRTDSLEFHRARHVYVEADPPMHVQYDGEVDIQYSTIRRCRLWLTV